MLPVRLFQDGAKAVYLGAHAKKPNSRVTVLECINAHDMDDVLGAWMYDKKGVRFYNPGQGFRYYVLYHHSVFSVPEWALRSAR